IEQPSAAAADGKDEAERDHAADEVARNHHPLAVEAVEHHAGGGPDQHGGDRAREHDAAHYHAGTCGRHGKAEYSDVVEVIADLAHHLADPRVAVVAVPFEQREEGVQPAVSWRTVMAAMNS